jgi:hypothetical protein
VTNIARGRSATQGIFARENLDLLDQGLAVRARRLLQQAGENVGGRLVLALEFENYGLGEQASEPVRIEPSGQFDRFARFIDSHLQGEGGGQSTVGLAEIVVDLQGVAEDPLSAHHVLCRQCRPT